MVYDFNAKMQEMINAAVAARFFELEAVEERMVKLHGEFVTLDQASKIINVSTATVRRMIDDGRLKGTADGKPLVMVRSMADMVGGAPRKTKHPEFMRL